MTFLSGFELVAKQLREEAEERARRAVTPQHAACEAAVAGDCDELARERARRVQHEADPVGEVATPDMDKAFRDAYLPPADYPQPVRVGPGDFRRGPITAGQDALGPGMSRRFPSRRLRRRSCHGPGGLWRRRPHRAPTWTETARERRA